ncbi:MAG: DinB family protein [Pyrinomonadaceae bacterium]
MNYQNISEIYDANAKIREKLKETVSGLTEEQANFLPEGEKWSVANLVEHISMVENGIARISAKLLGEAQTKGEKTNGEAKISEEFLQKASWGRTQKFEAPERVHPSGKLTIAESLAKLDENRLKLEELRPLFESVECSDFKFPHPAFGDMSAHEWLALIGGHELRHMQQIKKILSQIG